MKFQPQQKKSNPIAISPKQEGKKEIGNYPSMCHRPSGEQWKGQFLCGPANGRHFNRWKLGILQHPVYESKRSNAGSARLVALRSLNELENSSRKLTDFVLKAPIILFEKDFEFSTDGNLNFLAREREELRVPGLKRRGWQGRES